MKAFRIIKKIGKVLLITLLSLIVILAILITVALNSENFITRLALNKVSEMIDAPVKVDHVSLRLFKEFPYATVEFTGFKFGAFRGAKFDSTQTITSDTLVSFRKLYVSVKSRPLLKSIVEIEKIEIEGFAFNYFVDSAGVSNFDFLMSPDTTTVETPADTTSSVLDILLKNLTLRDITVNFNDQQLKATARIHIPEMDLTGRILDNYYAGATNGSILLSNLHFDDTNLNLMEQLELSFNAQYDDGAVSIKSMELITDGARLNAEGNATLGDSIYMDMKFGLSELNLGELIKYAPAELLNEFGLLNVKGNINMEVMAKGYLYDTLLLPNINANINLKNGSIRTKDYPRIRNLAFSGSVSAPNPNELSTVSARFRNISLATEQSSLNLSFSVSNLDKPNYDVKASALLNLDEFNKYLPDSTVDYITGNVGFQFSTKGRLPKEIGMESANYFLTNSSLDLKIRDFSTAIDSVDEVKNLSLDFSFKPTKHFSLTNLSFEAPAYNVALDEISLVGSLLGSLVDFDNIGVDLESFLVQMGNQSIEGKASVYNFNKPTFALETNVKVNLEDLIPFIPDSLITYVSGEIDVFLSSYGTVDLDSIDSQIMPIAFEQSKLDAKIRDFNLYLPADTLIRVNTLSLDFSMANDTIKVSNLYTNFHGLDIWVDSTEVWNLYKAFMLEQKGINLIVNTYISLGDVDYDYLEMLIPDNTSDPEQTASDTTFMPDYIIRGTIAATSVKYEEFFLQNVSTKFRVDEFLYVIDDLKFDAFGGSMITSAIYDTRNKEETLIQFRNVANRVNIRQLLKDADSYLEDMDFTYKNVDGLLTSTFHGRFAMKGEEVLWDKINVLGDFKLVNGGIYNYEPLMEIGKYTQLRELENIVFRTLESNVFIFNNRIYFPKTNVVSTALDFTAFGLQDFEGEYEYHLVVHLSDALMGKTDKRLRKQGMKSDIFEGVDKSKRSGWPLVAMDRDGEKRYGFDTKYLQQRMVALIRVQERILNINFHPRLVNFSTEIDRRELRRREE